MGLQGKTIGACFGRFDIVHYGHVNMLNWCKSLVDVLLVGVASDEYCERRKPAAHAWRDRATVVAALKPVDSVFCYNAHELVALWEETEAADVMFLNPEMKAGTERRSSLPRLRELAKVIWIPRTPDISVTQYCGMKGK